MSPASRWPTVEEQTLSQGQSVSVSVSQCQCQCQCQAYLLHTFIPCLVSTLIDPVDYLPYPTIPYLPCLATLYPRIDVEKRQALLDAHHQAFAFREAIHNFLCLVRVLCLMSRVLAA